MKYLPIAAALMLGAAVSAGAQDRGRGDDHKGDQRDQHPQQAQQVPQAEQQRRIAEEQQRQADYQNRLNQQVRAAQAQQATLQAQRHAAAEQQSRYTQALQRQQEQVRAQRDYQHDPYVVAPANYRYRYNGAYVTTNQYGVDVLRQAVNNGYAQCYQAGQADRADGVRGAYNRTFAYQDANYGYTGQYVPQNQYNYYFRQGCQRGYQDGYANQSRYGTFQNGNGSILGNLLNSILGLSTIR